MSRAALQSAQAHWRTGRADAALAAAWEAYDASPAGTAERRVLARILREHSSAALAGRAEALRALVEDPAIDPINVSPAGWRYLMQEETLFGTVTV